MTDFRLGRALNALQYSDFAMISLVHLRSIGGKMPVGSCETTTLFTFLRPCQPSAERPAGSRSLRLHFKARRRTRTRCADDYLSIARPRLRCQGAFWEYATEFLYFFAPPFCKIGELWGGRGGAAIYSAAPHSQWQRGSTESINGLVRWFFQKALIFVMSPSLT